MKQTPDSTNAATGFLAALAPQLAGYSRVSFACVAVKRDDGLATIQGSLVLEFGHEDGVLPDNFESDSIFAARIKLDAAPKDMPGLIAELASGGRLPDIAGRKVSLIAPSGTPYLTHSALGDAGNLPNGRRLLSFSVMGAQYQDILPAKASVDLELRAQPVPFESAGELSAAYGLPPRLTGDFSRVEVIASPVVELHGTSHVKGEMAQIALLASARLDTRLIRVGWRCQKKDQVPSRGSIEGKAIAWEKHGGILHGSYTLPVPSHSVVLCWASYSGQFQHQWWLFDQDLFLNPRRAIHECFDPKLEQLQNLLLEERNRKGHSRKFEDGVAYLLHLLGFKVVHFKDPISDAPDIVATTATHEVLVVECTRDRLNAADKLTKLKVRATQIQRAMARSDHAHVRVLPVIVTALQRSEVADELKLADEQRIAVVAADDIQQLLTETMLGPDGHQSIFERAYALVAQQPSLLDQV